MRGDVRELVRWSVVPLLPPSVLEVARRLRGRPLRRTFQQSLASWIEPGFAQRHDLYARVAAGSVPYASGNRSTHELAWLTSRPHMGRACAESQALATAAGIDTRYPLMDRRVIEFAATRPAQERRLLGDDKRLLRHALRGLLPDEVLDPRPFKTGTMSGHFRTGFPKLFPVLEQIARAPLLAEFGIVAPAKLREAVRIAGGPNASGAVNATLLNTLHAELWLRATCGASLEETPVGTVTPTVTAPGSHPVFSS